jgi:hypothetical protein
MGDVSVPRVFFEANSAFCRYKPSPMPEQRVMQVALGTHHSIWLTNEGVCLTAGENRFGQLGRVRKEQIQTKEVVMKTAAVPRPVGLLQRKEIVEVACGTNHCVALTGCARTKDTTYGGEVWAWGRNKIGQVGNGATGDVILPHRVLFPVHDGDPQPRITHIGAEAKSTCAVSDVRSGTGYSMTNGPRIFVWGALGYSCDPREYENTPIQLEVEYVPGPSSQKISNMIIPNDTDPVKEDDYRDQAEILESLKTKVVEIKTESEGIYKKLHGAGKAETVDEGVIQYTVLTLNSEADELEARISVRQKSVLGMESLIANIREQLSKLETQGTRLAQSMEKLQNESLDPAIREKPREFKAITMKIASVQEFQDANQNARMALLNQLSTVDKDKQGVTKELREEEKAAKELRDRVKVMLEISSFDDPSAQGQHDPHVTVRVQQLERLKAAQSTLKGTLEKDFAEARNDLRAAEALMAVLESEVDQHLKDDGRSVACVLLDKLLSLGVENARRMNNLIYTNHQVSDLDIRSFFTNAQKPTAMGSSLLDPSLGPS